MLPFVLTVVYPSHSDTSGKWPFSPTQGAPVATILSDLGSSWTLRSFGQCRAALDLLGRQEVVVSVSSCHERVCLRVKGHPRGFLTSERLCLQRRLYTECLMMSDVLKKLRSRSRHGRRVTRSRLFASNLKRKLKSQPNLRAFLLGKQKHSDGKKYESDKRVSDFRHWCKKVGLELHPNVRQCV